MKIRSVRAELFHAGVQTDGRTHMAKIIVVLRNFARVPNNDIFLQCASSVYCMTINSSPT